MDFPSILGDELANLKVYSIESVISEKFEAMVKLVMLNSRMKDFYDVFTLSKTHDFDGQTLQEAIKTTFRVRQTDLPDNPLVFKKDFHDSEEKQKQWSAFLRKTKLKDAEPVFNLVMERITDFLKPVVLSINRGTSIGDKWDKLRGEWLAKGYNK
jgi:predicted nucleotidyltransferase component of viral defense system